MASHNSPPSPTWLPSARPQGGRSQSQTSYPSTSRLPPSSRPLSSSTHLLQDLEPRTYDSHSDADSVPSKYKHSPPTPTQARTGKGIGMTPPPRIQPKPRWQAMQEYTDHNSEEEQHGLDPTPQPISRRRSRAEEELPRWARSTEKGRLGLDGQEEETPAPMQPEWMRSSTQPRGVGMGGSNKVKFEIPPPITASLVFPPVHSGGGGAARTGRERDQKREEGLLASIFGAFPGTSRQDRSSGSASIGRNRTSRLGEEWMDILRQERGLEAQIQELLDLQAEGLQRGVDGADGRGAGAGQDGRSRTSAKSRSNISEASMRSVSLRSSNGSAHRQQSGNGTLYTARLGLLKAMYTLSDLAAWKEAVLLETSQRLEEAHRQLLGWSGKLRSADAALRKLDVGAKTESNEDGIEKQIRDIDLQISALESQLREKKEERRRLMQKRNENRRVKEAEAARWIKVRRETQRDVERWLHDPDIPADMLQADSYWRGFTELTPQSRNAQVAVEALGGAIRGVGKRIAGVKVERDACERGAKLWSGGLEVVMKAEKLVKGFLGRGKESGGNLYGEMVEFMGDTLEQLEEMLQTAEQEHWSLIVCALGAEVEAWKLGVDVAREILGDGSPLTSRRGKKPLKDNSQMGENGSETTSGAEDIRLRRHSGNTNSTEDPMWGSGVDKDAEIIEDPAEKLNAAVEELNQHRTEVIPDLNPTKERRRSHQSEGNEGTESNHIIYTEGLKISPSHSPWLKSSPAKRSVTTESDRETSFRTAMEYSGRAEEPINKDAVEKDEDGREKREREEREARGESPEESTPRQQRLPPHSRKGAKLYNGKEEESDGEVPADLLG